MKKIFAFCVSIFSLLAFLLSCALPASALQLSDREDYDLQLNNGTYLKFDEGSLIGGTYRETSQSYAYTLVTVQDATSVDALKEVLGEDLNYPTGTSVGGTYTVKENQYVFSYDDSMDYESLYDIAGVEKVEFAKWDYVGGFIRAMLIDDNDTWVTDNNIDTSTLLMATVYTEKDVEITAEMFEAVGCPVRHVYMYSEAVIEEGETEWRVYCDLEDLNSYLVFDDAIQQVKTQTEGVVSGGIDFGFTVTGEENFTLDEVTPSRSASAEGSGLMASDLEAYDYYSLGTTFYTGEDGSSIPVYTDRYFQFNDTYTGGTCDQFSRDYRYVFVTVDDTAAVDVLTETLGEEETVYYYTVGENQHVFAYDASTDYENLYDIAGVEKVELAKHLFSSRFSKWTSPATWMEEEGLDADDLIQAVVTTEDGVELTADTFADTDFTIRNITQSGTNENEWFVYFDLVDLTSYQFDAVAQQIDGISSASIILAIEEVGTETLVLDEVTPPVTSAEAICGDVNLDGSVDICDAVLIQQYMADSVILAQQQTANGDCNGDGVITAEDSASLLRFLLCITDTLPET